MGEVFVTLLNRSITAGWFILAVLCFRLVFRKSPKWVNCLLWGVVAVRLVCPFSIESRFSLLPSAEPVKSAEDFIPSIDSRLTIVKNTINPMLAETFAYHESESVSPWQAVVHVAGVVWICGMIVLLICAMCSVIRLHRLVMEAVCVKENIYICDAVTSPFILGIVRPRVYLPSALNEKDMGYIIAHESAHLKRKDHWWKAFGYGLLCVYWFYPLCWLAYFLFCRDIELACDERAVKRADFHEKKEYSRVLLSCARQKREALVCPLAFGEVGVKERVKSVLHYKKPALWIVIAAVAICVMLAVCFLTNPEKEYQIRVTIPAGSTKPVCYSDEEISPKENTVTFYAGEGLGDTEISLLPIEVREENAYDEPAYLTPGMAVKMDVEKGAWFKIGVNVQNPTNEDKVVYVSVRGVEVRIASSGETENRSLSTEQMSNEEDVPVNDIQPTIIIYGAHYYAPYMPVDTLPDGYEYMRELTEAEANDTGLAGCKMYDIPERNSFDRFYLYQECGTPIGNNTVDPDKRQWAYVEWIREGFETHYYAMATDLTRAEVEDYANSVKQSFMEHDWPAISSEISYPITISGTTYPDSAAFLDASDSFDSRLNETFFSYLKEEDCVEMFINSQGIMLGATGQVWIADVLDDQSNSHGLKIITINDLLKE